jgi:hypothetical protein
VNNRLVVLRLILSDSLPVLLLLFQLVPRLLALQQPFRLINQPWVLRKVLLVNPQNYLSLLIRTLLLLNQPTDPLHFQLIFLPTFRRLFPRLFHLLNLLPFRLVNQLYFLLPYLLRPALRLLLLLQFLALTYL